MKRLGPVALSKPCTAVQCNSLKGNLAPAKPSRWVGIAVEGQTRGRGLVRRLSALAGLKSSRGDAVAADVNSTDRRCTEDGGRRDSWVDRLSGSGMAQQLGFLSSNKDTVVRGVAQRDGNPRADAPVRRPVVNGVESVRKPRVYSPIQVVRRLSSRWTG